MTIFNVATIATIFSRLFLIIAIVVANNDHQRSFAQVYPKLLLTENLDVPPRDPKLILADTVVGSLVPPVQ